jgi:hypothetical protein
MSIKNQLSRSANFVLVREPYVVAPMALTGMGRARLPLAWSSMPALTQSRRTPPRSWPASSP